MKTVIVTGATGFLGRSLVPMLVQDGHKVVCLTRDPDQAISLPWSDKVSWVRWNLLSTDVPDVPAESRLIHLAWPGLPNYRDSFHVEQNFPASLRFIQGMVQAGVKHVLVAGTCLEYGMQSGPLSAQSKTDPALGYAIAKDALRRALQDFAQDAPFTLQWARLFYLYGPGQASHALLPQLDRAIDAGDSSFPMSGGAQVRDFLTVSNAADQIRQLLDKNQAGVFNVCSGNPITVRRFVEAHIAKRKARIQLDLGHFPYPDYEPMEFWGVPWMAPE